MFKNVPSLICRLTLASPRRIIKIHRDFFELFGFSDADVKAGAALLEPMMDPEDLSRFYEAAALAQAEGNILQTYYRLKTKNGAVIWVMESGTLVEENGILCTDSVITDVSILRDHSKAETQSLKLESLGKLAATVAHDINNVLGAVRLCAEMIEMVKLNPEKISEYSQNMIQSVDAIEPMISELLAFGRKGNAPSRSPEKLDNIATLGVDYAHDQLMCGPFASRPIQLMLNTGAGNIYVDVNSVGIQKVIEHLIRNAAEWMPQGGEIHISTSVETIPLKRGFKMIGEQLQAGRYGVIEISDTGTGIAPEDMDHIFDPFFSRREGRPKNKGLGLPVVYGIMKSNHCGIEYSSSPEGSSFRMFLPILKSGEKQ